MTKLIIESSDETFQQDILQHSGVALVDFWAEWCGPCKMLGPILEHLAQEFEGRVKIAKINVDHSRLTASQYGIRSIPTLILFKGGQPLETKVGALSQQALSGWLADWLTK